MTPNTAALFAAFYLVSALLGPGLTPPEDTSPAEEIPAVSVVEAEPEREPEPSYSGPQVPAQEAPAEDDYFADAAFIGNSLVDGFRMYSGLSVCDYYAATSKTVFTVDEYITQMSGKDYGKIYILLGINEIGYSMDRLMSAYGGVLDRLAADHPDALIYIMGISPVSANKDAAGGSFTMANVRRFNENLYELAQEKECYYIDLCDALAGEDGFLPANKTWDGIHFNASYYKVWLEYLQYHYIPAE